MKIHIPDFTQIHVLIVGDIMLDRYWYGATSRISPEAPVPVVKVDTVEERPGGGANVAVNIASLGGMARVLGVTGDDTAADALETKLARLHDLPVLVDSKGYDFSNYRGATLLTPNLNELETVLGPLRSEAELVDKGMACKYSATPFSEVSAG
jgi:bifunctional ADP-heptose synthase (sugar kinase/adenylyltransferase)